MKGRIMGGFPLVVSLVALLLCGTIHAQKLQTDAINSVSVVVQPHITAFPLNDDITVVSMPGADHLLPLFAEDRRPKFIAYNAVASQLPVDYGLRIRCNAIYFNMNQLIPVKQTFCRPYASCRYPKAAFYCPL